ncbi:DUF6376 family protein [Paenibacillus pasadenensis]|uniref:DUF6376 family protein n=1 Tax=Paenibacillus pasadenensis TaxID=217090 RepID=UPI00203B2B39|nr:DUF6376 family protein [Paenibacillus pasadenensis]MCM3749411.1 DUF6376 family protein [Paenibacillus pasadenensis]
MSKRWLLALILAPALIAGCSLPGSVNETLDNVNNSLSYVNEATTYINDATQFSQQLPDLAQQALTSKDSLAQLESELIGMQADIKAFNELSAPAFAEGVDAKLEQYNAELNTQITKLLDTVQAGQLTVESLEQSQIGQTVSQISSILEQVQQLGN